MPSATRPTYQLFSANRPAHHLRRATLLNHLAHCTAQQFAQLTGLQAATVRLTGEPDGASPVQALCSFCQPHGRSSMCRVFAESMVSTLDRSPGPLWQRCPYEKWSGLVALRCNCSKDVACQVIGSSTVSERTFSEQMRLLEDMSRHMVVQEVSCLNEQLNGHNGASNAAITIEAVEPSSSEGTQHHIWNAVAYIHEHLSEPDLTVASVAQAIGLNATYVAHMFSTLMGMHMRRFINVRRVQLAKILLTHTDWQVKQIAFATGHDSPQWFSHVFQVHAGTSPGQYRRKNAAPD